MYLYSWWFFDCEHIIIQTLSYMCDRNDKIWFIVLVDSPDSVVMPPTPPSSSNSDSEGCCSPQRSASSSPLRVTSSHIRFQSGQQVRSHPYSQPLFTNPVSSDVSHPISITLKKTCHFLCNGRLSTKWKDVYCIESEKSPLYISVCMCVYVYWIGTMVTCLIWLYKI